MDLVSEDTLYAQITVVNIPVMPALTGLETGLTGEGGHWSSILD